MYVKRCAHETMNAVSSCLLLRVRVSDVYLCVREMQIERDGSIESTK